MHSIFSVRANLVLRGNVLRLQPTWSHEFVRLPSAALCCSTEDLWFQSGIGLTKQLQDAGIYVSVPAPFVPLEFNKTETLQEIKRTGKRVIFLMTYEDSMAMVASMAAGEGMNTKGWAWVLGLDLATGQQLGWLFVRPLVPSNLKAFARQVSDYSKSGFGLSADSVDLAYSLALHDSIMLYAHAATKVLAEGGDLRDGAKVTEALRNTTFHGKGNRPVSLDQNGDRIGSYGVMNYVVGADNTVSSVSVGVYSDQKYTASELAVVWPGDTTDIPADHVDHDEANTRLTLSAALGGVALLLVLVLLVYNVRKHRHCIKTICTTF